MDRTAVREAVKTFCNGGFDRMWRWPAYNLTVNKTTNNINSNCFMSSCFLCLSLSSHFSETNQTLYQNSIKKPQNSNFLFSNINNNCFISSCLLSLFLILTCPVFNLAAEIKPFFITSKSARYNCSIMLRLTGWYNTCKKSFPFSIFIVENSCSI